MQDFINTVMLICASLASLAFGVLVAYALCRAVFATLRAHARSVAPETAKVQTRQVARLT